MSISGKLKIMACSAIAESARNLDFMAQEMSAIVAAYKL